MNPALLLLASTPSLLTIDLTSGPVAHYLGVTRGLAFGLFVFCLFVALMLEAFGKSPTAPRDFGGVLFRAGVVLILLTFYPALFGSLFGLAEGIASRVVPNDAWGRFVSTQAQWVNNLQHRQMSEPTIAGHFFDSLVALVLLLGQASLWILNTLGRVLSALLYVLGPLPLVFAIPRGVDSGGRWFRVFVSVLCWPILSGLLVSLTVGFGLQGMGAQGVGSAFESLALAGLMAIISLAVPLVASSLVGGSLQALSAGVALMATVAAKAGPIAAAGSEKGRENEPRSKQEAGGSGARGSGRGQAPAQAVAPGKLSPAAAPAQAVARGNLSPAAAPSQAVAPGKLSPAAAPAQAVAHGKLSPAAAPAQAVARSKLSPAAAPAQAAARGKLSPAAAHSEERPTWRLRSPPKFPAEAEAEAEAVTA